MKALILAGGLGTRLSEETTRKPKPMVEIGGFPVLWHIMKIYAAHGIREFIVALGYKSEVIKDYFINYRNRQGSISLDLSSGEITLHGDSEIDNWKVHLLETGLYTMTGGRINKAFVFNNNEPLLVTYGDGIANVNIKELIAFHKAKGKLATVTAVRPPARFGEIVFNGDLIKEFSEKPQVHSGWINGGFFVLEPEVKKYISGDDCSWERQPMELLAEAGQLSAYRHDGFWQCMDTLRDVHYLNQLWDEENPPWKVW